LLAACAWLRLFIIKGSEMNQSSQDITKTAFFISFISIIIAASVLRFYQLDSQMWLDEFSALASVRRSWIEIVTIWPGVSSHILFELLANWSAILFGESTFSLRLPAALFGILGVITLVKLGARISTFKTGLFISALMAVSYNHIFYSQNIRGYTALIFFFLWTSYLFLSIADTKHMELKQGITYFLATVLTCYSQPFGVFIPVSQSVIAFCLFIFDRKNNVQDRFPIKAFIGWMALACVVTLLLYSPFYNGMISHAQADTGTASGGGASKFDFGLIIEVLEGLAAAFHGYIGLLVVSLLGAIGMIIWARKHLISLFVLVLPLVIQAIAFIVMGVGIHPRYFAIAIPIIFIAGGIALFYITGFILSKIVKSEVSRSFIQTVILCVIVIISSYPLIRYYSIPKQDFQGALKIVEELANENDVKVGVQSAGTIMKDHFGADFVRVDKYEQFLTLEKTGRPLWVITTLERIMELSDANLINHIRNNYKLFQRLPGTVGDGSMQIYGPTNMIDNR
jgi:mannosyltransferase